MTKSDGHPRLTSQPFRPSMRTTRYSTVYRSTLHYIIHYNIFIITTGYGMGSVLEGGKVGGCDEKYSMLIKTITIYNYTTYQPKRERRGEFLISPHIASGQLQQHPQPTRQQYIYSTYLQYIYILYYYRGYYGISSPVVGISSVLSVYCTVQYNKV